MLAVIVDRDTLRAVGLRHILGLRHDVEAVITADPRGLDGIDDMTLFFVTPEAFASMPMFYVPRRQRVVLVADIKEAPLPVINPRAGEEEIKRQIDSVMATLDVSGPRVTLSDRERQILKLVAIGRINKEIACELGISFNTVLTHRKNIASKLGVKSAAALSVYAMMNGLLD